MKEENGRLVAVLSPPLPRRRDTIRAGSGTTRRPEKARYLAGSGRSEAILCRPALRPEETFHQTTPKSS